MYTQVLLPALKNLILANPDKEYVTLTLEDYQNIWCTCPLCAADSALYNRILREDLNIRYAWIMLYGVDVYKRNANDTTDLYLTYFGSYCPQSEKLSYEETVALQNSFLEDAVRVGLYAVAEHKYVSYLQTEWQRWQIDNAPEL